jgi:hypothetical protein
MAAVPVLTFNIDDAPERPELHASRQKLKDLLKPAYWQVMSAASQHLLQTGYTTGTALMGLRRSNPARCSLYCAWQLR